MSASPVVLRGLTWGHRRAIAPLAATRESFRGVRPDIAIDWAVRDLRAFEHQPLEKLVETFDFIVFDHPFIGRIAHEGLFAPIDDVFATVEGADDPRCYAGPSLASYQWDQKTWGAPVDAATMHAIFRSDLMETIGASAPAKWDDVITLGREARRRGLWLGLANGDHHGFLAIGTLMYNVGAGWSIDHGASLRFDIEAFRDALSRLKELSAYAHPDSLGWNSIALHDAMTSRDDLVYCPLTYGYATYGEADFGRRRLSFANAPGSREPYASGTLAGGAAIGLSARSRHQSEARDYLRHVLAPDVQIDLFGLHHGQPARQEAWRDADLDTRFNGYFSGVAATLELAAVRPRFRGYGVFEKEAGALLIRHLGGALDEAGLIDEIMRLVEESAGATTV